MSATGEVEAVRRGAGLFRLPDRGLLSVTGADRTRWLNGMLSNDVAALAPGPERSGCYAMLLTPKGRIVADLHVLLRPDALWLETAREAISDVKARLERYVVADDVALEDRSEAYGRLALEGPRAGAVLRRVCEAVPELGPDACADLTLAGEPVVVAAFGWSGEPAFQLWVGAEAADGVERALLEGGSELGLVAAGAGTLEVLRIEAGVPRLGAELDEDVLPDEARLERAASDRKGCYTGQEIVARLRSRGHVNHLLVGLRLEDGGAAPAVGARIRAADRDTGEVTSACVSPRLGPIALGFVRRDHAEPGTSVSVEERSARVAALPFPSPDGVG